MFEATGFWKKDDVDHEELVLLEKIIRKYYQDSYYEVLENGVWKLYPLKSGLNTGDRFTTWFNSFVALGNLVAAQGWCIEQFGKKHELLINETITKIDSILAFILGDDLAVM